MSLLLLETSAARNGRQRRLLWRARQLFNSEVTIRVNTDITGDIERFLDNIAGRQVRIFYQCDRSSLGIGSAGADSQQSLLRLNDIAITGNHENGVLVSDDQQRFEAPQHTVTAPIFGHFDRCSREIATVSLQLALEALEEGKCISCAASKAGDDLIIEQSAHLASVAFHDGLAQRDLTITANGDSVAAADRKYRCASELFHVGLRFHLVNLSSRRLASGQRLAIVTTP